MLTKIMNSIDFQKRAMDASSKKQEIISNNIANVETPNYKSKRLIFESLLSDSLNNMKVPMARTNPRHMDVGLGSSPYIIETDNGISERLDGNNVNIDVEMAEQAKNTIKYNALITETSGQIRRLRSAIKGGR